MVDESNRHPYSQSPRRVLPSLATFVTAPRPEDAAFAASPVQSTAFSVVLPEEAAAISPGSAGSEEREGVIPRQERRDLPLPPPEVSSAQAARDAARGTAAHVVPEGRSPTPETPPAAEVEQASTALTVIPQPESTPVEVPRREHVYQLLSEEDTQRKEVIRQLYEGLKQAISAWMTSDELIQLAIDLITTSGQAGEGAAKKPVPAGADLLETVRSATRPFYARLRQLAGAQIAPELLINFAMQLANIKRAFLLGQSRIPDAFLPIALAHLCGWGPLEPLRKLPGLTEVIISPQRLRVVQHGQKRALGPGMDAQTIYTLVEQLARKRPSNRKPNVDFLLADGSRGNATHASIGTASICIRHHPETWLTAEEMVDNGMLTPELLRFFRGAMAAHLNIVISGSTDSGKTSLLKVFFDLADRHDRVIIIEEGDPEVYCSLEDQERFWSTSETADSSYKTTLTDLVRIALRKRPDRICVGECRGDEVLAMLQAMNTGHDGSLSTVHASSSHETLLRFTQLAMGADRQLTPELVGMQLATAIHLVVFLAKLDGARRVVEVLQVAPSPEINQPFATSLLFHTVVEGGRKVCRPTTALLNKRILAQCERYRVSPDALRPRPGEGGL
jgi:Flp pilus assembly CpaF family ATPase